MATIFRLDSVRLTLIGAALFAASVAPAAAQAVAPSRGKLDWLLQTRAAQLTGRSRVIVEFNAAPDVRVFGRTDAGRRLGPLAQVVELENRALGAIASDPRVARVMADRPVFPTLERTRAAVGATLARQQLGVTGTGIGVAVIDSGIASWHDDLFFSGRRWSPRVALFKDFTRGTSPHLRLAERQSDDYGHGTHVAGIIAGSGFDSEGARAGVAPGAHLIGLKVLDGEGHGHISDVIAAIDYAIAVKAAFNVRVINLSVASGVFESYWLDPLTIAARRAVDAGIVVVAAAGNLGRNAQGETQFGGITAPGNAPWVLTVGASSHQGTAQRGDDATGGFSSRGPTWIDFSAKPDMVAPGVGIESLADGHSALYAAFPEYLVDGSRRGGYMPYLSLSGTSMAAPVVAGTVALMLQANPTLTPNGIKAILQYTAEARPAEAALAQGAGLLNAAGALRLARFFADPLTEVGALTDMIEDESVRWARHIVWGNFRVTGGIPLPGSSAWAPDLTWGALKTRAGAPVIWGATNAENIVWSTADDNIVWSTRDDENIVWSTGGALENSAWSTVAGDDSDIVWSTAVAEDPNVLRSTAAARNVVWGADCGGRNCQKVVWGSHGNGVVWGTVSEDENIVWSTMDHVNIVWSTAGDDQENIVWGTPDQDENIVWSTGRADQVLWQAGTP
jgi:serine protease AprX